jgi:hypothetical protein
VASLLEDLHRRGLDLAAEIGEVLPADLSDVRLEVLS